MSEFEKWVTNGGKEQIPNELQRASSFDDACRYEYYMVNKDAWKAALEWAKDTLTTNANGFFEILKELKSLEE